MAGEIEELSTLIEAQQMTILGLREALDLTAGTLRNLFDRYIHNDSIGAEVWADLEADRVLAMAARHLRASPEEPKP